MASSTLNTCGTLIDFQFSVRRYSYYLRYCYLILQSILNTQQHLETLWATITGRRGQLATSGASFNSSRRILQPPWDSRSVFRSSQKMFGLQRFEQNHSLPSVGPSLFLKSTRLGQKAPSRTICWGAIHWRTGQQWLECESMETLHLEWDAWSLCIILVAYSLNNTWWTSIVCWEKWNLCLPWLTVKSMIKYLDMQNVRQAHCCHDICMAS